MPLQDSWVEHWLDRYCEPSDHKQLVRFGNIWRCAECGKESQPGYLACLICNLPAQGRLSLSSVFRPEHRVAGPLCGICRDEFFARKVIRGWRLTRVG